MKSIVRRDTQESYTDYRQRLAEAEGLEQADEAALRRMERRRSKKGSNPEWINRMIRKPRSHCGSRKPNCESLQQFT
jgi:hypothetical protein